MEVQIEFTADKTLRDKLQNIADANHQSFEEEVYRRLEGSLQIREKLLRYSTIIGRPISSKEGLGILTSLLDKEINRVSKK